MERQENTSLNTKKGRVLDYLKTLDGRLAIPLWEEETAYPFLCLDHLKMSEALGFTVEQVTPLLRQVKSNSLESTEHLEKIIEQRQFDYHVFEEELAELCEMKKTSKTPVGGGTFGPLTVASGIIGMEKMMRDLRKNPEYVKKFVSYITEFMVELAKREKEEGADFFWIAEPLASVVSPKNFWEFSGVYLREIFDAFGGPGCLHVCGPTMKHTAAMVETGAEVLSIDSMTDVEQTLELVPEEVVVLGNISPIELQLESKEFIFEQCMKLLERVDRYDNFILSTGCNVIDGTPIENIMELYRAAKEYPRHS